MILLYVGTTQHNLPTETAYSLDNLVPTIASSQHSQTEVIYNDISCTNKEPTLNNTTYCSVDELNVVTNFNVSTENKQEASTTPITPNVLDCTTDNIYSAVVRENGEKVTIHIQPPQPKQSTSDEVTSTATEAAIPVQEPAYMHI